MSRSRAAGWLLAALLAALLCSVLPALAQQPAPTATINQVDASAYPEVKAIVTATDARGIPVRGLSAADFQAFDGQQALLAPIVQTAQNSSLKLSVVVVIDVSGSMQGAPLDAAKLAATQFVQNLGANDEAAIVAFSDRVTPVVDFTGDGAKLTNGIASLQAIGDTALYDAVQTSAYAARASGSQRSAVVLLTDGQNAGTDSPATAQGSTDTARDTGVPVFTIGFGDSPDVAYLQNLSGATQGQYRAATEQNVGAVYSDLADMLRSQYVLTLKDNQAADGKPGSLRVVVTVAGAPIAAVASFTRGAAPVAAVPVVTIPSGVDAAAAEPRVVSTGRSSTPLLVFSALVLLVLAAAALYLIVRWRRRRRILREQLATVASNPAQAAAQPLPRHEGAAASGADSHSGTGRLLERVQDGNGRAWELLNGPAVIGSSPRLSTILIPDASDVAPEHARIWLRNGRYVLHHTAGTSRKTLVAGREADWVTLEPGDEVQVGRYRFLFEDPGSSNGTAP